MRRRVVSKRKLLPDPKYRDRQVTQFVNAIMRSGKKAVAEKICYGAFTLMEERGKEEPLKMFKKALDNVKPITEVRSRRVGGASIQVPVEVRQDRRVALALRWIIQYSKQRGEKTMEEKLSGELMDAASNRGNAVKKKEDTHKMADANKAFAHYRW